MITEKNGWKGKERTIAKGNVGFANEIAVFLNCTIYVGIESKWIHKHVL